MASVVESSHHCEASQECCPAECGHEDSHHQHDEKCPPGHHHHCGGCLHQLPLGVENGLIGRLPAFEISRLNIRAESERVPDGPFQALDKPPLI